MIYDIPRLRAQLASAFPEGSIVGEHTATEHWYRNTHNGKIAASVTTKHSVRSKPYLRQWAVNEAINHISKNIGRVFIGESEDVFNEAKHAHENTRDQAATYGTTAHGAYEDYLNDWINTGTHKESAKDYLKEGAAIEEIAACRSFDKFIAENEIVPIAAELKVWYDKAGVTFAGTVDSVIVIRDTYKDRNGDETCDHNYAPQENKLWCIKCNREVVERLVLGDWKTSRSIAGKDEYAEQTSAYAKAIENATKWKFRDVLVIRFDKSKACYEIMKVNDRKTAFKNFALTSKLFDQLNSSKVLLLSPIKERNTIVI